MNLKPWQLILVIIGFGVCIGSIIWTVTHGNDEAKVNHVIHYIDVESGQIYRVDITKNNPGIPAKNPDTGKVTLVRLDKKEDGAWYVNGHDRMALGYLDKSAKNTVVDPKSGDLNVPPKAPIDYKKH